jgi:imidazolonepropionase-like amidohydrolase
MILIQNGFIWTGRKTDSPSAGSILIDGPIIKHIFSQSEDMKLPDGVQKLEASSGYILPGLINCHTHVCLDGSPDPVSFLLKEGVLRTAIKAAEAVKRIVLTGVTTIRDLGANGGIDIALRDSVRDGILAGPRMLVSGEVICMTGGHGWFFGHEIDGADEARKATRKQLKSRVDLIKVMATGGALTEGVEPGSPQLTVEEMKAAVEEAEKAGRRVACHAHGNTGILNALKAGVHTIEHGTYLDEKAADLMIERNVYYVPTVSPLKRNAQGGVEAGIPEYAVRNARNMMKQRVKSLHLAFDKGINILVGTDAGTPLNPHGDIIEEIKILKEECMETGEALAAATSLAAKALGIDNRLGTLEAGKIADLIIVEGNPFNNLDALRKIVLVMKEGKVIFNKTS